MSDVIAVTVAHRAVRNQASIDLADIGGPSTIKLYTEQGGTLLGVRTLAQPCGTITAEGRIQLMPAAVNDLVAATGTPTWAEWCNGAGVAIAGGAVTDEAGAGPFRLKGSGTMIIYEGGVVALDLPSLLG